MVHSSEEACCPNYGCHLKPLGEDVSEVLVYVPGSFRVIRHVRPKLACGRCDTIVQAPEANRLIARGMAGSGLLAHVQVAKYCDHLPLYRQSGTYSREGVDMERSTLADWVGRCSALLRPLVERLQQDPPRMPGVWLKDQRTDLSADAVAGQSSSVEAIALIQPP